MGDGRKEDVKKTKEPQGHFETAQVRDEVRAISHSHQLPRSSAWTTERLAAFKILQYLSTLHGIPGRPALQTPFAGSAAAAVAKLDAVLRNLLFFIPKTGVCGGK